MTKQLVQQMLEALEAPEANEWKEAMLDGLAAHATDMPVTATPREILAHIIKTAVVLATAPAIAAPDEPVAWLEGNDIYWHNAPDINDWIRKNGQPLYTRPAPKVEPVNRKLLEALKDLLQDTQHAEHECGDEEWCPVIKARAAISQAEGKV